LISSRRQGCMVAHFLRICKLSCRSCGLLSDTTSQESCRNHSDQHFAACLEYQTAPKQRRLLLPVLQPASLASALSSQSPFSWLFHKPTCFQVAEMHPQSNSVSKTFSMTTWSSEQDASSEPAKRGPGGKTACRGIGQLGMPKFCPNSKAVWGIIHPKSREVV
jgi:hypothetical protein